MGMVAKNKWTNIYYLPEEDCIYANGEYDSKAVAKSNIKQDLYYLATVKLPGIKAKTPIELTTVYRVNGTLVVAETFDDAARIYRTYYPDITPETVTLISNGDNINPSHIALIDK